MIVNNRIATERGLFLSLKYKLISHDSSKVGVEYKYDVFGKAYIRSGKFENWREFKQSKIDNTRLFTGREFDKEIGLYYYRARYYSSELGRFISRDPIGQVDDVNLYGYVGNNPVMGVDPSGLEKSILSTTIGYSINRGLLWPASITSGTLGYYNNNFSVAPELLLFFSTGDGKNRYFDTNTPIAEGIKKSKFYSNELNSFINNNYDKLSNGKYASEITNGRDITGKNGFIKDLDIGIGLGKTTYTLEGKIDNEGYINTKMTFYDYYDFDNDKDLGIGNTVGFLSQESGAGKPYYYSVSIEDKILFNN